MEQEKITVVIPMYNSKDYIERCLNSICNQTYKNLEIIVIDDGSQDKSKSIVEEFQQKDSRIKYFYQENQGPGVARNVGIEKGTGKYISFIDSDDEIRENFFEILSNTIQENDSFALTGGYMIFPDGTFQKSFLTNETETRNFKVPISCNKLFNFELIREKNLRFKSLYYAEDIDFWGRLLMINDKFSIANDYLYLCYFREDSLTRSYTEKDTIYQIFQVISNIEDSAKINNKYESLKENFEFLNIKEVLIRAMKQISQLSDFGEYDVIKMLSYVEDKYPNWYYNKYIKLSFDKYRKKRLELLFKKDYKGIINYLRQMNSGHVIKTDEEMLAENIVDHSISVEKDQIIQIRYKSTECNPLVVQLIREIQNRGAVAIPRLQDLDLERVARETYDSTAMQQLAEIITKEADFYSSYISIGYSENDYDFSRNNENPAFRLLISYLTEYNKIVRSKKSVSVFYPSPLDAHKAKMTTEDYKKYAFSIMNYDYKSLKVKMEHLKEMMDKTSQVAIIGKDTDLTFSKKDIPSIILSGEVNIPDGEVYTSPIKDSVNGTIRFNVATKYMGNIFESILLEFKNGKVVDFDCSDPNELRNILDIDKGSRFIGEFALGVHPLILYPIINTLHDEKIYGSFHLALGQAYRNAYNGNDSNVHWDLINIQRDDFDTGKIFFDDILIRENGEFVPDNLKTLNDERARILTKRRR